MNTVLGGRKDIKLQLERTEQTVKKIGLETRSYSPLTNVKSKEGV